MQLEAVAGVWANFFLKEYKGNAMFHELAAICVAGAKLCYEAYFVLERHERGESSGKLLDILFLRAEQALQHQPDSALKVHHTPYHKFETLLCMWFSVQHRSSELLSQFLVL